METLPGGLIVQFSSRRYQCAQKSPYAFTPSLRSFPNVAFGTVPNSFWFTMAISRPFKEDRLALPLPRLSPPGDRWCDVLGSVPAVSVSSFSTLPIFREVNHVWGSLFPPVYLLGHFLHSGMSRAVNPQEISKVDVDCVGLILKWQSSTVICGTRCTTPTESVNRAIKDTRKFAGCCFGSKCLFLRVYIYCRAKCQSAKRCSSLECANVMAFSFFGLLLNYLERKCRRQLLWDMQHLQLWPRRTKWEQRPRRYWLTTCFSTECLLRQPEKVISLLTSCIAFSSWCALRLWDLLNNIIRYVLYVSLSVCLSVCLSPSLSLWLAGWQICPNGPNGPNPTILEY